MSDLDARGYGLDPRAVARGFGAASAGYDAAAVLQAAVREELLSRVEALREAPALVLDLGCGTGAGAAALKRRFPRARVIAADIAPGMLQQARRRSRWWRRFEAVVEVPTKRRADLDCATEKDHADTGGHPPSARWTLVVRAC